MRIGLALFPGLCQLDMTGPHEVMARYPGAELSVVAASTQTVATDRGLAIRPDCDLRSAPQFDVFVMPGGPGQQALMADRGWLGFLTDQARAAQVMMGVCTGSLVLGAAGLLKGYRATTHWSCHDLLALLGARPVAERVVIDRDRVTAAGSRAASTARWRWRHISSGAAWPSASSSGWSTRRRRRPMPATQRRRRQAWWPRCGRRVPGSTRPGARRAWRRPDGWRLHRR